MDERLDGLAVCSFAHPLNTPVIQLSQAGASGLNDLHWADGQALVHVAVEALGDGDDERGEVSSSFLLFIIAPLPALWFGTL